MMPTTQATGQPTPVPLPLTPGDARRELKALLAGTPWCRMADSVVLAVHEALTNADRHGGGVVRVHASVEGDSLVIEVCDRGCGFEMPATSRAGTAPADLLAEHGRGVWLINQIATRAETGRDNGDFWLRMWFGSPGARARR